MTYQTWELVAETREWVGPITVTVDDVETTDFTVTMVGPGERPTEFTTPTALEGELGILVGDGTDYEMSPYQKYTIYAKFSDSPEVPLQLVGFVKAK